MMTDCTTSYDCTETGCPPCAAAEHWIDVGGIAQWLLAGLGVLVLVLGLRAKRPTYLALGGVAVLALSWLAIVNTTSRAQDSYCQPDTPGYDTSYCVTE
jgi:hypothetical protein